MRMKQIALIAAIALPSVAILSCNSIAREERSGAVGGAGTQNINQVDLQAGAAGCATSLGTVELTVVLLQDQSDPKHTTNNNFNDVKLDRYQVTYQRTDGGKLVPPAFVRSTAQVLAAGGDFAESQRLHRLRDQRLQPGAVCRAAAAERRKGSGNRPRLCEDGHHSHRVRRDAGR